MKHRVKTKKLNRRTTHRQALYSNLLKALFEHGSIKTTAAKAKIVQSLVDKRMTQAKKGTLNDRRQLLKTLHRRSVVNHLVDHLAPAHQGRTSGYTQIIKLGSRPGDATMMVELKLIDYQPPADKTKPQKTTTTKSSPTASKKLTKSTSKPPKTNQSSTKKTK